MRLHQATFTIKARIKECIKDLLDQSTISTTKTIVRKTHHFLQIRISHHVCCIEKTNIFFLFSSKVPTFKCFHVRYLLQFYFLLLLLNFWRIPNQV